MRKEERLIRLYARLPELECKGLCSGSCGPIPLYKVESELIRRVHGKTVKTDDTATCSMLLKGRCSIYAERPLICRLWGMVEGMKCPHGCVPRGGVLSDRVGRQFIKELSKIDGEDPILDGEQIEARTE